MANVLLGATGSVAAVRVPALFDALSAAGHSVKVVATDAATYFFDPAAIQARPERERREPARDPELVILDADEWPGRASAARSGAAASQSNSHDPSCASFVTSTSTGPGRPVDAMANASRIAGAMSAARVTR